MELKYPLILDGSTGTQLQKRGFDSSISAEDWVLQHPEVIPEVQNRYIDVGSQVVYAPTFGANRTKLERHGIFNKVAEYNEKLVAISKNAVGDAPGWPATSPPPASSCILWETPPLRIWWRSTPNR